MYAVYICWWNNIWANVGKFAPIPEAEKEEVALKYKTKMKINNFPSYYSLQIILSGRPITEPSRRPDSTETHGQADSRIGWSLFAFQIQEYVTILSQQSKPSAESVAEGSYPNRICQNSPAMSTED